MTNNVFQPDSGDVDVVAAKLTDAMTPGAVIEFDPLEAEQAGAFEETALSEEDALDSTLDLEDAQ